MAKRIVEEARECDLLNVVLYWEDTNHNNYVGDCWIYRHTSSPGTHVNVRLGGCDGWKKPIRIRNTYESLFNLLHPPHACKIEPDFYFYVSQDGNIPPHSLKRKDLPNELEVIDEDFIFNRDEAERESVISNFCRYVSILMKD